jgi:hypothetical protein
MTELDYSPTVQLRFSKAPEANPIRPPIRALIVIAKSHNAPNATDCSAEQIAGTKKKRYAFSRTPSPCQEIGRLLTMFTNGTIVNSVVSDTSIPSPFAIQRCRDIWRRWKMMEIPVIIAIALGSVGNARATSTAFCRNGLPFGTK